MDASIPEFSIGQRTIGDHQPAYVIAEAGVNHSCNLETAFLMVREAKAAGADAIKFQAYKADLLVTRWAPRYWDNDEPNGTQHALFRNRESLDAGDMCKIAERCALEGITFLCTPFDSDWVHTLDRMDISAFKICSADLTDDLLLSAVGRTGRPVIQSTGGASLGEVEDWLHRARRAGVRSMALLHCVLCYPTSLMNANLKRIQLLSERFRDVVVGYSDHTMAEFSVEVAVAAVAVGARIIEKHFTLDRAQRGDDHYHSANPDQFARLIEAVRRTETALGRQDPDPLPCEQPGRQFARRSLVAIRDIPAGQVIVPDMLAAKRPGTGIAPTSLPDVVGRRVLRDIPEDSVLSWSDVSGSS